MPLKSSDVSPGEEATAIERNNLRDDALNLFAQVGSELTIVSGVVTIASTYSTFYDIDTESDAATDDLDTINGGDNGEIIIIRAENAARTVLVKHGADNISLKGAQDLPLVDQTQLLMLRYDGSNWVEVSAGADRLAVFGGVLGVDDGGIIPANAYFDIPYMPAVYLLGIYAMADVSGSINIDIRTETFGSIPDSADSIGTSPCFAISTAQTASDTSLSAITNEQAAGCWRFIATGASTTIEQVSVVCLGIKL